MLRSRLFPVVVVACAHGAASADLLVTPTTGEARSIHQTILSSQPPSTSTHIDPLSGRDFAQGGGFASYGTVATNYARSASGHTAEFFLLGLPNPGNVDYIRFRGHAGAQAILNVEGATTAGTGTSEIAGSFVVTNPVAYTITGFARIADAMGTGPGGGAASAGFRLSGPGIVHIKALSAFEPGILNLNESGVLQPGTDQLRGFAAASASVAAIGGSWVAGADYEIRMDFQPVPTPGLLAAAPLVGLVVLRRRR